MSKFSKVVVTGGAGFIGSHLVDRLLSEGFEVTVIDNLITGRLENIAHQRDRKDFHFIKGDIREPETIGDAIKEADAVFHEAALVSVNRSVENPTLTNEINVSGTLTLLRSCIDSEVKRVIYASSSSVYGEIETLPKHEELACRPISPYAVSKLAAENYIKVFHQVYGLKTVSLRYFNVYGSRQTYGPYSGVITIFINRLLTGQQPVIYGDGEQKRDFTNVQDVVEANMLALEKKGAVGEVFNIATGVPTSVNELATTLLDIVGRKDLELTYTKPRPGDVKYSYAAVSKAKKILGYHPKIQLREGLVNLVNYRRKALDY